MILQALTRYYEDLLVRGEISVPGWSPENISYALRLDADGQLAGIIPTMKEQEQGKKTVLRPRSMKLPSPVKRSSGMASNFLWDNSSYILGVDQKGKPERSLKCFQTAVELHHKILDQVDSFTAKTVLKFFDTWEPDKARERLGDYYEEVTAGGNLVFRVDGAYAQDDTEIREAWERYWKEPEKDSVVMQCLVTGKKEEIPAIHAAIKGVRGAQSSGAALLSFNAPAFCSYGHEQNYNAPVGKTAASAYTEALNYLLADREHVQQLDNTTVICWAEGAEPAYQDLAFAALFGTESEEASISEKDLRAALKRLSNGLPCEELGVDPERPFYILGISPNAARLSVRFFYRDYFGRFMRNVQEHYNRLEIVKPSYENHTELPLWKLLRETVNQKSKDKSPNTVMAGAVARAVFSGGNYPVSLLEAVMLRIRAEREINWKRAAILKAYYLKNGCEASMREVLTVSLNEKSTNPAYTLGRLFAVYEEVQQNANPGINATIKDKYFNSAAAMPASIFPILGNLYQKHLKKMDNVGTRIYYEKQVSTLKGILGEEYPVRMTLAQQGSFDLGYYHQTQKRYTKKEEK